METVRSSGPRSVAPSRARPTEPRDRGQGIGLDPPRMDSIHSWRSPGLGDLALRVRRASIQLWGEDRAVDLIGQSPVFLDVLAKIEKIARYREPVLITGESGTGKENIAQAIYLLSEARGRPFASVNCPQHREGNLTVSELFGHRKGSFTGAVADRIGAMEAANGGVMFLDEIADLHLDAQAMLLRALASGEFKPIGADRTRTADVRVVAATNRPLSQLVVANQFRNDLYFRLRYFLLPVPPLRERGDDWRLLLGYFLERLREKYGVAKRFSTASCKFLEGYDWPGNVRQVLSVATTGYAMADGDLIEPVDFACHIEIEDHTRDREATICGRMMDGGETFWDLVHRPFMDRELNRRQVKAIIRHGLIAARGSYREMLNIFHLPGSDYQKLMDFLRHYKLKP